MASTTFFDLTGKSTQKPWKYITIRKIKTVPSRHDNFPRNSGIPAGTAPFGACDRGKIPCRDGDGDEKPPTTNLGTGTRTRTMLPAPQGPRISVCELVKAFVAPFSSSSRTVHFWVSQLRIGTPIDPSINSIAPLETQQVANDAQSNLVEEAKNSPNIEEVEDVERSPNKRGLTSAAWTHFKRKKIKEKWKAICKYCEKKLGGDTRSGTKHLHDHIRTCKLRTMRGPKQSILKTLQQSLSSEGDRGESILVGNYTFNQDAARMELKKMIALHEYPLAMVDHIGFRRFCNVVQPLFKDGMSIIHDSFEKIKDNVSFWVGTPKREEEFIETCEQLEIPYSKKLMMDCRIRRNSTYLMLVSALPYLEVFKRLTQREPEYKSLPSDDDWKMTTEIYENTIQGMTDSMIPKFEKYWGMINRVMAIGVILDPRLKMKLLKYFFPLMYGSESTNQLNKVTKLLEDLVSEYQSRKKMTTSISTSSSIVPGLDNNGGKVEWSSDFLKYVQETSSGDCVKSELDLYLEEPVLFNQSNISNFDILGYWKNIGVKHPTLQRIAKDFLAIPISTIAKDFLAIPISTVASESVHLALVDSFSLHIVAN
ncbi:Zinc finger BED domain-containing protein RICESLEEPER 2 [Glycine soja]